MIADPDVLKYFQRLEEDVSKLYVVAKGARGADAVKRTRLQARIAGPRKALAKGWLPGTG